MIKFKFLSIKIFSLNYGKSFSGLITSFCDKAGFLKNRRFEFELTKALQRLI